MAGWAEEASGIFISALNRQESAKTMVGKKGKNRGKGSSAAILTSEYLSN
jgi:hypothetical protein